MREIGLRWAAGKEGDGRRGTTATELALILPILLLLALGCLSAGEAVERSVIIANAAQVGAEYAATHRFTPETRETWASRVEEVIWEELETVLDRGSETARISIETAAAPEDEDLPLITVEVAHDFTGTIRWPGLPDTIPLQRRICIRQYR